MKDQCSWGLGLAGCFVFGLLFFSGCGSVDVANLSEDDFSGASACGNVSASFSTDVLPIFQDQGCTESNCHGMGFAGGGLNLDVGEEADGADGVYDNVTSSRVNLDNPSGSAILERPLGIPSHTGGNLFGDTDDTDYQTIFCWIEAGAEND